MLRWLLSTLILGPFALLIVLFAVSNRQMVEVALWPLPDALVLPVYLLTLPLVAISLLTGAAFMWMLGHKARATARRESKRAQKLEKELAEVRAAALRADAPPASGSSSAVPALPVH